MPVDIIILSNGKTPALQKVTRNCIESCHISQEILEFNIVVIEQSRVKYKKATTYVNRDPFNYNQFLNLGISLTSNEYVCLCNNDLIFHKDWVTNIIKAMKNHNLLSACPLNPSVQGQRYKRDGKVHFGYRNSWEMSGWCIMVNRELFKTIGKLNEDFPFWFADNVYAEQLKKYGIAHGLVSDSVVTHLSSKTLETIEPEEYDNLTRKWIDKFCDEYPENESAIHFKKHRLNS